MKIAASQLLIESGEIEKNTKKMLYSAASARKLGCDVVLFSEMSDTGYDMKVIHKKAQEWQKGTVPSLCEAAKQNQIHIIAGVSEKVDQGIFNSTVSISSAGKIVGSYRKTHLITAEPMREHEFLMAGSELGIVDILGMKTGIMTCYEIRFPEIARSLALVGAKMIVVPSAWPLSRISHWKSLLIARAIENQIFIAAVNRIGEDAGVQFGGLSLLIDPWGIVLAEALQSEEDIISAEFNFNQIDEVRSKIKVFQDRRVELYQNLLK